MNLAAVHSLERELSLLLINSGKYLGKIYFTTKILYFGLIWTETSVDEKKLSKNFFIKTKIQYVHTKPFKNAIKTKNMYYL